MIDKATTLPGQIIVLVLFLALAIVGIIGCTQLYKDFKLEWFIPDDSYVNEFFQLNREHFSSGTPVSVNIKSTPGHFESQTNLRELYAYLSTAKYTKDGDSGSWYKEFMDWSVADAQATRWTLTPSPSSPKAEFAKRDEFHTALHQWYRSSVGGRYRNLVQWADTDCNVESTMEQLPAGCDLSKGIKASRFSAEVGAEYTTTGNVRYDTMDTMRKEIHDIYPNAFPWNFDFLYWEEVGVIDVEFVRNIIICGVVVCIMVFMLVPAPRIAIWVVVCISLSIVDVLGMMYFWDVTISGVSTIYVLISIGLAVDYSAHIAHMFKESMGSPRERALAAIDRIGPSTFNAVFSTFLAVVVVGFSKSFVFRVFFKVLFLVTSISGAHGIVLLPVILSIVGGSQADETVKTVDDANQAESDDPKMQAEIDPKEANTAP
jgi:predicted RND superfamily exporter protein